MTSLRHVLLALLSVIALLGAAGPSFADVQYVYDSAGRLMRATYSNGVIVEYRYDSAGNRRSIITSQAPNDPPTAVNDVASVNTSAHVDIMVLANDSDPDGDTLTVTAVGTPTGGGTVAIQNNGAHVRYTAPATAGPKTFTYTVSDGKGGTATATVTVTVTQTNRPPVAVNDAVTVVAGSQTAIMVRANDTDPDGDTLTVTSVTTPSGGGTVTIMSSGSYVRYNAPTSLGVKTFTYTVSDGNGASDTATVTVTVIAAPNSPPNAVNDTATVVAGQSVNIQVRNNDTDPDGDTLTVTSVSTPSGGGTATIMSSGTYVRYTAPSTRGTKTFTYTVSDGNGGTATATVTVTVTNAPPVAVNDTATVRAGQSVNIQVRNNDTDLNGDTLTVTGVTTPSGGGTATIMSSGTYVRYTAPSSIGTKTFNYTISDGNGGTATATVTVTVTNNPPTAVNDTATVYPGEFVNIMVRANDTDPDGDPLTVTGVTTPSGGGAAVIMSSGAHVRYTAPSVPGTKTFNYTISDGRGGTSTAQVTVTVPNRAPTAVNDSAIVREGLTTTINVLNNDIEPDGQNLTITSITQPPPGYGTVYIAPGGAAVQYYAAMGGLGFPTFTYTISDGYGGTATATVSLNVLPNCGPGTGITCP